MSPDPAEGESRNPPRAGGPKGRSEKSTFHPNPAPKQDGAARPRPKPARSPVDPDLDPPKRVAEGPNLWERILFGRVSSGQLAQFCRQFSAYLHAGVDIIRSLSSLEQQFSGTALGPVLGRIAGYWVGAPGQGTERSLRGPRC